MSLLQILLNKMQQIHCTLLLECYVIWFKALKLTLVIVILNQNSFYLKSGRVFINDLNLIWKTECEDQGVETELKTRFFNIFFKVNSNKITPLC